MCITAFLIPLTKKGNAPNSNSDSIIKGFLYDIHSNRRLRTVCLLNVLFSMILVSGYQILQTYLLQSAVPKSYNGLLYFIAAVFASCGSFFFDKLQSILKSGKILLLVCMILISVCFFELAHVTGIAPIFLLVSGYRLVWGVASPMFAYMVNQSIRKDDYRNTVFSIISLFSNLSVAALLFVFGTRNLNVRFNYVVLSLLSFLLFLMIVCSKNLKH